MNEERRNQDNVRHFSVGVSRKLFNISTYKMTQKNLILMQLELSSEHKLSTQKLKA